MPEKSKYPGNFTNFIRGSVLEPTLEYIGLEPTFLKSHQIPKSLDFEIYWTRANTKNEDIGLEPTLFSRVHSRSKIRFGIKNTYGIILTSAQKWILFSFFCQSFQETTQIQNTLFFSHTSCTAQRCVFQVSITVNSILPQQ